MQVAENWVEYYSLAAWQPWQPWQPWQAFQAQKALTASHEINKMQRLRINGGTKC